MITKSLLASLVIAACHLPAPGAAEAPVAPEPFRFAEAVPAQAGPTCCVREYLQCFRNCECGVFEFNCRIDPPACSSSCLCNICPAASAQPAEGETVPSVSSALLHVSCSRG